MATRSMYLQINVFFVLHDDSFILGEKLLKIGWVTGFDVYFLGGGRVSDIPERRSLFLICFRLVSFASYRRLNRDERK